MLEHPADSKLLNFFSKNALMRIISREVRPVLRIGNSKSKIPNHKTNFKFKIQILKHLEIGKLYFVWKLVIENWKFRAICGLIPQRLHAETHHDGGI